jgi:hypothetical protein
LNEISVKFGYASNTIKDVIKDKTLLGGNIWQYYEPIKEKMNR